MWPSKNKIAASRPDRGAIATTGTARSEQHPVVSVVLPVYNELAALPTLVEQLAAVLSVCCEEAELVFVDDGSTDGSRTWLDQLTVPTLHTVVVHLSRNFGHQAALQAGLEAATGDVVVIMDSDLQDNPKAIPLFLEKWAAGYDVVYAIRTHRKESWFKRGLFAGFYRILNLFAEIPQPLDAGNFSLLDSAVVQQVLALPERERYFPGLRNWVGHSQIGVHVERQARHDDKPRVSIWGLCGLARTAIWGFSQAPVHVLSVITGIASVCAGLLWIACLIATLQNTAWPDGLGTSALCVTFFALNALGLRILGEYASLIYQEVRGRPSFCISEVRRSRPQPLESNEESDCRLRVVGANLAEQFAPRGY